jgi:gluconolactonase
MELHELVDPSAKPRKVAGGFGFTQGPVFSRRGYLLFSDMGTDRILKWERGQVTTYREKSNASNGLTFDHQGRLLACEHKGRVTRTEKNGAITVLASDGLKAPNDLVYAIDGSIYFSDLPASRLYQITPRGRVRVAAQDCRGPNGVALAPNQLQLYAADSGERIIRVYDVSPDGALSNSRVLAQAQCGGLKTDEAGNVWAASGGAIRIFDGKGRSIGSVAIPEEPTNLAWGEGFRGLYITAQKSVYHLATKVPGTRTF